MRNKQYKKHHVTVTLPLGCTCCPSFIVKITELERRIHRLKGIQDAEKSLDNVAFGGQAQSSISYAEERAGQFPSQLMLLFRQPFITISAFLLLLCHLLQLPPVSAPVMSVFSGPLAPVQSLTKISVGAHSSLSPPVPVEHWQVIGGSRK